MNITDITQLLVEAKDAFGSANADKLGRLVERLSAALEHAMSVIAARQGEGLTESNTKAELLTQLTEHAAAIVELKAKAGEKAAELAFLKTQVFGSTSERLSSLGTSQPAIQTPTGIDDDEAATTESPPADAAQDGGAAAAIAPAVAPADNGAQDKEPKKKEPRRRGRQLERNRAPKQSKRTLPGPEVGHEILHHLVPPNLDLACPLCGELVKSRGKSTESREIDVKESAIVTRTHHCDKAACGCGALSFVMPGPVRAVPNMIFSPAFAAKVLVDKFFAHLPLNRQAALFEQQGLKISRDRLIKLVIGCWLAIEFLVKRIREVNRLQSHQGCDESPVRVVVDGEKEQRYIWCLTSKLAITYQITAKRNKETAREVIGTSPGVLTSDRLAIYRKLIEDKDESGCMSHLRRYFWYALDTAPEAAMPVLELIGELYDVEAEAKGLVSDERKDLRVAKSTPILFRLEAKLKATAPPPRTPIAKAVNYALTHWPVLIYYMTDGAVEIDNNECERRLRAPKLGWANWKQPQSELGIEAVAGFYTIIATCALHRVNPRRYLTDVLTKIASGWPASRLDELLPWNWRDQNLIHGPPAPRRRNVIPKVAEVVELARVRARIKAAKDMAAAI